MQKKGSAAGIGMGSRFDSYKKKANLPAPDKYQADVTSTFGKNVKGGAAWRAPKPKTEVIKDRPGPGDYV